MRTVKISQRISSIQYSVINWAIHCIPEFIHLTSENVYPLTNIPPFILPSYPWQTSFYSVSLHLCVLDSTCKLNYIPSFSVWFITLSVMPTFIHISKLSLVAGFPSFYDWIIFIYVFLYNMYIIYTYIMCTHILYTHVICISIYVCVCAFSGEAMSEHFATLRTVAHQFLCPRNFPGKNAGVRGRFLLQGIFQTEGLNSHLLDWQVGSLPPSHQGSMYTCTSISWFWLF